ARRLAAYFTLHVLFARFAAEADDGLVALRVLDGGTQQVVVLGVELILVGDEFFHQGGAGFAVAGEFAGGQEQAAGAVAQHVVIVHLFAFELWHGDRLGLGGRGFAVAQEFAGVLALGVGAAEVLAET